LSNQCLLSAALSSGFTPIELLVVIAIIAILVAIGITAFTSAQRQSRDARRMADMRAIQYRL